MIFIRLTVRFLGGIYNLKHKLNKCNSIIIKKILLKLYSEYLILNGSYIGHTAQIDGELITPHGLLGIFISGDAILGKNCVVFQQVTIGSNTVIDSKVKGSPKIGDSCYIGAGAKIIGNIRVGNNVRIGANAVVVKDVPDNSVVISQEVRVLVKESLNNRFYSQCNGSWGYYNEQKWIKETDENIIKILE